MRNNSTPRGTPIAAPTVPAFLEEQVGDSCVATGEIVGVVSGEIVVEDSEEIVVEDSVEIGDDVVLVEEDAEEGGSIDAVVPFPVILIKAGGPVFMGKIEVVSEQSASNVQTHAILPTPAEHGLIKLTAACGPLDAFALAFSCILLPHVLKHTRVFSSLIYTVNWTCLVLEGSIGAASSINCTKITETERISKTRLTRRTARTLRSGRIARYK